MDYALPFLGGHLGLRLFQADYEYFHANFGPQPPYPTGGRANLKVARLSTGLIYHMGSILPPPPVTYSCTAAPSPAFPGDPVTVTGTATNLNPKKTATYSWTGGEGVKVTGDNTTGAVDTTGLNPGNYTVTGHVSEGQKVGQFADCTANFTIKQYDPPTHQLLGESDHCSAWRHSDHYRSGCKPAEPATDLHVQRVGRPDQRNRQHRHAEHDRCASRFHHRHLQRAGRQGSDGYLQRLRSMLKRRRHRLAPKTKTLCSINFDRDKRRPARVDNEAKACLDDVALNLQQQTDATAVLVGEAASDEKKADTLAAQRAVNTKDYLVKEKGIDRFPDLGTHRNPGQQGSRELPCPCRRNLRQRRARHHSSGRKHCEGSIQNSASGSPAQRKQQPHRRSKRLRQLQLERVTS